MLGKKEIKFVERYKRTLWIQSYLPEIIRGLGVTMRHFFRNLISRLDTVTLKYPFEKENYPDRYRGVHRLIQREDGSPKCVACFACVTICPANCIYIEAGEYPFDHPSSRYEKYPIVFKIDQLKCIYCGFCVEICPCDAIRMDSGLHPQVGTKREEFILTKEDLLKIPSQDVSFKTGNPDK